MITSGSMPFSLASASMVCCSALFMAFSKFHFEPRTRDECERNPVPPPVGRQPEGAVLHAVETARERRLAVHRLGDDQLGEPAREPREVGRRAERAIQTGRRNLERIFLR